MLRLSAAIAVLASALALVLPDPAARAGRAPAHGGFTGDAADTYDLARVECRRRTESLIEEIVRSESATVAMESLEVVLFVGSPYDRAAARAGCDRGAADARSGG